MATKKYLFKNYPIIVRHTQFVNVEDKEGNVMVETWRLAQGTSELRLEKQHVQSKPMHLHIKTPVYETDKAHIQNFIENLDYFGREVVHYEPEIKVRQTIEAVHQANDAITEVRKLDAINVQALGRHFFGSKSLGVSTDSLRVQLFAVAQDTPEQIFEMLDENKNANTLFVLTAFALRAIKEKDGGNSVAWNDTDAHITNIPKGKDVIEEMVEFLKTKDGAVVKKEIGLKLKEITEAKVTEKSLEE